MASPHIVPNKPDWNPLPALPLSELRGWTYRADFPVIVYDLDGARRLRQELDRIDDEYEARARRNTEVKNQWFAIRWPVLQAFNDMMGGAGLPYWISPIGVRIAPPDLSIEAVVIISRQEEDDLRTQLESLDTYWLPIVSRAPERAMDWIALREPIVDIWRSRAVVKGTGWPFSQRKPERPSPRARRTSSAQFSAAA